MPTSMATDSLDITVGRCLLGEGKNLVQQFFGDGLGQKAAYGFALFYHFIKAESWCCLFICHGWALFIVGWHCYLGFGLVYYHSSAYRVRSGSCAAQVIQFQLYIH